MQESAGSQPTMNDWCTHHTHCITASQPQGLRNTQVLVMPPFIAEVKHTPIPSNNTSMLTIEHNNSTLAKLSTQAHRRVAKKNPHSLSHVWSHRVCVLA